MNNQEHISAIEQYVIDSVIRLRGKHHLSQEAIGHILGVERSFISKIESSKSRAKYNLNHIDKLADYFGLSPKDFLPDQSMQR